MSPDSHLSEPQPRGRRWIRLVWILLALYLASYAVLRVSHIYVHSTGMYRDGVRHSITSARAAPVISVPAYGALLLHYPLKATEEIYWNEVAGKLFLDVTVKRADRQH
ncbi:hypothetical protein TSACC_2849 [Terrimicrobium sacchariphilum]|uniref:Uncharacterized protein n=1 Tax=Terrimicrobium sacchariphilum TaxID=690879 RepID=A0A146G488_TERSA|nr:hypothetical protein [Terrimicrobium sacchariphilum]GAT32450.1 hypothetical protein TSACC_2849 [Terrimicrobium sacchariphilum]